MKPQAISPRTAVKLLWEDSSHTTGWHYPDAKDGQYELAFEPHAIATIGFVVVSTKAALTISDTYSDTHAILNPLTIPWGCIRSLDTLKKQPFQETPCV